MTKKRDMTTKQAWAEIFWKAYSGLDSSQKKSIAQKILSEHDLLDDWYDHVLIERAKSEKGKSVLLEDYVHP